MERLFLVRHGVAEDDHPLGDHARGLTEKGRRRFRKHAREIARTYRFEHLVSSPLVRAVQTAELLAAAAKLNRVELHGALIPGPSSAQKLIALAKEAPGGTALVGHEPALSEVAAALCGMPGDLPFPFKKGGVLVLQREGRTFSFEAFHAPRRPPISRWDG